MMSKACACCQVVLEFESGEEFVASSHVLRLASPVFEGMLAAGMGEARSKRVAVSKSSKAEFVSFYDLMLPGAWSPSKVTEKNVDELLVLGDYYQVDFLKAACEDVLMALPVVVPRLLQAHVHGLRRQYERCLEAMAHWERRLDAKSFEEDLKLLEAHPRILMDLTLAMQRLQTKATAERIAKADSLKRKVEVLGIKLYSSIPKTLKLSDGRRVDEFVRDSVESVVASLETE